MRYVTRPQWGARPPKAWTPMPRPVPVVYVHHDAGNHLSDPVPTIRQIQRTHQDVEKWRDIAYQEWIAHLGDVFEGRGFDVTDGATAGESGESLSICLQGNFELVQPTDAQLDALVARIVAAARDGRLTRGFAIKAHQHAPPYYRKGRNLNATACCGRNLLARLPEIRARVTATLTAPPVTPEASMADTVHVLLHPDIVQADDKGGRSWPSTEALAHGGRLLPLTNPAPVLATIIPDRQHDLTDDLPGSRAVIDAFRNAV